MGNNDLAIRFTENYYATKNEVSRELKISVIDGVWDKILSYRSPFYHYLLIKGIDKNQLRVCLCPTIANKANQAEAKMLRLINEYNKLDRVTGDAQHFSQTSYIKSMQNVAVKNDLVSDEETLRRIIHGEKLNRRLGNYYDALKYIETKHNSEVNVDYLADLFSLVTGNPELTYFYRDTDVEDINSSSIISRVYKCAPHQLIEQMMDGLFAFIAKSNLSSLNKSIITYYYVQFVKPFKHFNDEIASLLMKAVLAHDSLGEFAACIPFEFLLNENAAQVNKLFTEVQATSDVTYFLTFALDSVTRTIEKMLDSVADYTSKIIKNDFFKLDEDPKVEQINLFEEEQPAVEQKPTPTPVAEVKPAEPIVVKEVVREIIREVPVPTPAPVEAKKEEPVKEEKKVEVLENKPQGLAVSYIPDELDEKTASRLEKHLLELDVRLKKGQAYFYARHCTLGMYYTIEQYKKAVKCVYETARTSMEKLVEFGYYKKQAVGKKFVYTPVDRKWV